MSDSSTVMRYVAFIAIIAVVGVSFASWDVTAPQVSGWSNFQSALSSDPFTGAPSFPSWDDYVNYSGSNESAEDCGWDLGCVFAGILAWMANGVNWFFGAISFTIDTIGTSFIWVFTFLTWLGDLIVSFFGSLFQSATLTYSSMPPDVQTVMWIIIAPLIAFVIYVVLKWIRGAT